MTSVVIASSITSDGFTAPVVVPASGNYAIQVSGHAGAVVDIYGSMDGVDFMKLAQTGRMDAIGGTAIGYFYVSKPVVSIGLYVSNAQPDTNVNSIGIFL